MARYWQAKTFLGFYVEGRNLERRLAQTLSEGLGGETRTEEIMGAGIYMWLGRNPDPSLRIKDIGDRTLIELVAVDRSLVARKPKRTAPPTPVEEAEGAETIEPAAGAESVEAPVATETPEALEDLRSQVEGILAGAYTKIEATPAELKTKIDLKLQKWERPQPMAIITKGIGAGEGEIDLEGLKRTRSKAKGGLGGLIAMLFAVVILGGLGYYLVTTAANDPYYVFEPGTEFTMVGSAFGYVTPRDQELIIIKVPTRLDTLWVPPPRFVRAETDTVTASIFTALRIEDLRIEKQYLPSVVLEPDLTERVSTATLLDVSTLVWNRNQGWEQWFASEINRGLVRGSLEREGENLWLVVGNNKIQLVVWELLSDEEKITLQFAEQQGRPVLLEVRFQETLPYRSVRTAASRRLFKAEVRQVTLQ
jgi:hypothetical protein